MTLLSALQLLAISWISFQTFGLRNTTRSGSVWSRPAAIWGVISVGFLFLAVDEYFMVHENIDGLIHYVFNLQETPLTDRIDDILIAIYGLVGVGLLFACRRELGNFRVAIPFFVSGFVLLFVMVVCDVVTNQNDVLPFLFGARYGNALYYIVRKAEDPIKLIAIAFFLAAFCAVLQQAKTMGRETTVSTIDKPE